MKSMNENTEKVVEYYDRLAGDYDRDRFANTYGQYIDLQERALLAKLGLTDTPSDTLEMACGTGRFLEYANVGIDASEQMLAQARNKYPHKVLVQCPAQKIPMPDASFSTIYSFHLMMHLPVETIGQIMQEAHRLLRPGGRFIFDIPSLRRRSLLGKKQPTWHGRTALSSSMVRQMCSPGFDVRSRHGILFLPIHKLPASRRFQFLRMDTALCSGVMSEFSSYLLFELVREP